MIFLKSYFVNTTAETNLIQITSDVNFALRDSNCKEGLVTLVIPGPGAGLAVFEPIPELLDELKVAFEIYAGEGTEGVDKRKEKVAVAPRVQAAMLGRTLSLPVKNGKLLLEPYEEVFLIDFEKKPRRREFYVQVISEAAAEEGKGAPQRKR